MTVQPKSSNCIESNHEHDDSEFAQAIARDGYCVLEGVIPPALVKRLKCDLEKAIELESEYHKNSHHPDRGMVLFCPFYGDSFIELLEHDDFVKPAESVMGDASILYSFTSSSLPPGGGNYAGRVHNDCPIAVPESYILRLIAMVALDDFTLENGSTYVLPGSHRLREAPDEADFYAKAKRLTISSGSVWYADARIWHAGGINTTDKWRHAVSPVFTKAYIKQRLDIPKLLIDKGLATLSDRALQKLGFWAQVPQSYDEYYAKPSERKFKQKLD